MNFAQTPARWRSMPHQPSLVFNSCNDIGVTCLLGYMESLPIPKIR